MQAWYTFNRIDNFGQIDPAGPYWKPDSNILTPAGYPVTALSAGVVTAVQRTSWGQTVVTIRLDTPLNSLASHTFFEHLHDATVAPGQRVGPGMLIGHANYSGEGPNLGFGFYSGDVYGSGSAWDALQKDLAPGGRGLLNPVAFLDALKSGKRILPQDGQPVPLLSPFSSGNSSEGPFGLPNMDTILNTLKHWGEYVAVFLLATILIIMGILLLASPAAEVSG